MNKIVIGKKTYFQHPVLPFAVSDNEDGVIVKIENGVQTDSFMLENGVYHFKDHKTKEYYPTPKFTWECHNGILPERYKIVNTNGLDFYCDIKNLKKKKIK